MKNLVFFVILINVQSYIFANEISPKGKLENTVKMQADAKINDEKEIIGSWINPAGIMWTFTNKNAKK